MSDFKQFTIVRNGSSSTYLVKDQKARNDLDDKVDKIPGKGLSTNDFTDILKSKLDGIESGATRIVVDSEFSSSSTNPVQNKIVKEKFDITDERIQESFRNSTVTGPIASFPDGADDIPVKSLLCTIAPVQDLHGYDNPWPAGGGVNAMPCPTASTVTENGVTITTDGNGRFSISGQNTSGSYMDIVFSLTAFTIPSFEHSYFYLFNSKAESDLAFVFMNGETDVENWALSVQNRVSEYNAMKGATCNALVFRFAPTFNDTLTLSPMICDNGSETSFTPYSNICPISGHTDADVVRTGKNLLGVETLYAENTLYSTSGSSSANSNYNSYRIKAVANQPVTLSAIPADTNFIYRVLLFNTAMDFVSSLADNISGTAGTRKTATVTPSFDGWIIVCARKSATDKQVEVGSTATSYEPYQGNTYHVSWQSEAGTVYGGTLDVVSGLLTVTMASVDLGTLTWSLVFSSVGANRRFATNGIMPVVKKPANTSVVSNALCSNYKTVSVNASWTESSDNVVDVEVTGTLIILDTSKIGYTVKQFKTAMSGVYLVYELATPQTYQLTAQEVNTLVGENVMWHDANGDTTVTYCIDPNTGYTEILSDDDPLMNGTASSGISNKASRADHIHPHDSSKQDVLTFDSAPTEGSSNPVTSDGIYESILKLYPVDTASGSIASFPDGADNVPMKSVVCDIAPVQDLHGYDNPWPAGGGKNKLKPPASGTTSANVTFTVNADGTITANGTSNGNADLYFVGASSTYEDAVIPSGAYILTCEGIADNAASRLFVVENGGNVIAAVSPTNPTQSVTLDSTKTYRIFLRIQNGGSVSNAVFKPMIRLSSIADDTFAPYSNICPISGFTGLTVTRTGVNVWNEEWENGSIDGSTGQNEDASGFWRTKNYIPIVPNETYYISCAVTGALRGRFYDINKNYIGMKDKESADLVTNRTFIAPSNARFVRFAPNDSVITTKEVSVNYPSTDTSYHAYQGQTYTIDLDGTRYGGTLDVTSGKLTVDRAMVDMGTLNWGGWTDSAGYIFNAPVSGRLQTRNDPAISSQYTWNASVSVWSDLVNGQMTGQVGGGNVYVRDTRYSSIADFKTGVSSVQLVYPIATPIEVQLTPTEITTLLGTNNIWADAGDTTVNYYADPTLFVNKKIAAAVAALS